MFKSTTGISCFCLLGIFSLAAQGQTFSKNINEAIWNKLVIIYRSFYNKLWRVFISCCVFATAFSPAAFPQSFTPTWTDLGPGQIQSNAVNSWVNVEGMNNFNNPITGAITKVLVDPSNPDTIYVGAVNGGIWKTIDGGKDWIPKTDRLSSLSIGSLNFDSTDPANQTLIAGTGRQSAFGFSSGPLTGIQYSTDGGNTWTEKGRTQLLDKDIVGVAARGDVMLAAVRNINTPITGVGLYRSTNGGTTFSNATAEVTGLPTGNIQNLAADPTNSNRFYLSVVNGNDQQTGIYRSVDKGASWTQINSISGLSTVKSDGRILLSVGAQGVLVAQIQGKDKLELLYSADQGNTWTDMQSSNKVGTPDFTGLFPGGQTSVHGAVLVDPYNPDIVYVAGDRQAAKNNTGDISSTTPNSIGAKQWSIPIFRGVYDPTTKITTWNYITNNNTLSGSAPHADARTFAVDSNGRLLFGGDGGLNAFASPGTPKTMDWIPIMSNLRTTEMTQSYWNPVTHTVSAAAQDVGAFYQFPNQRGTYNWSSTSGGDGGPSPVNFKDPNLSIVYSSSQNLGGFFRFEVGKNDDAEKAASTFTALNPVLPNGDKLVGNETYMSFLSLVALNRDDPKKMAIGGKQLFIGTDDPTKKEPDPNKTYTFPVTSILTPTNEISSLAYGATNKINALLAGAGDSFNTTGAGNLYYTPDASAIASNPMTELTDYRGQGGKYVWSAIFDERDAARFYVADGSDVWRSSNTGTSFTKINGDLPATFVDRQGLAFASNNGVNALFVGGVSNVANGSGVYVTRFTGTSGSDAPAPSWSSFGGSLANAPVFGLSYSAMDDVLLVNLLGRGAWVVYDATSYFPEATNLVFGKADNNSSPDAALLTDGTQLDNGASFSRSLIKYGTGTLAINGAATYTGLTTIENGTLALGPNGSLQSEVDVKFEGTLRGSGQITGPVNVSGTLAPGNSPGTLTVIGTVTQAAGSKFAVDIDGSGTGNGAGNYSRLLVKGSNGIFYANGTLDPILRGITGSANNNFTPAIGDQFRIVTAQAGIQGRFSTVNQPALGLTNGTRLDVFYNGGGSNSIDQFATPSSYATHVALWGGNNNARSVGQVLDFMRGLDSTNMATTRQNELRYELAGLRSAQIASYATALSGEVHGAMAAVAPQSGRWLQTSLARQLAASPGSLEPAGLKAGDNGWLDFNASQGRSDGGSASSGYTGSRYQFALGADILHSQTNRLGVGVTYANTSIYSASGSGTIEEVAPLVYGQYAVGTRQKVIFDNLFAYGFNTWQTQRSDPLRGVSPLKTNASGNSVTLGFGVRSPFAFGPVGVEPFVRVLWQNSSRGGVNEGLALPAALGLSSYSLNGTRLLVGTAVGSKLSDPLAALFTYRASVAFGEDFGDLVYPTVQASLAGTNFKINSPNVGREFVQLNLSVTCKIIDSAYVYAGLNGEARENRLDGGVNAGFNLRF